MKHELIEVSASMTMMLIIIFIWLVITIVRTISTMTTDRGIEKRILRDSNEQINDIV